MSNTTKQRPDTSLPKISRREWEQRLKVARAQERQLKAQGQARPNPTKRWSEDSWKNISQALSEVGN